MNRQLFSSSWHIIAELTPKLSSHARIERHTYRETIWYVIQDQIAGRYCRVSLTSYRIICSFNGIDTVTEIWDKLNADNPDELVTQNDLIDLMIQLHSINLLQNNTTPDAQALFREKQKKRNTKIKQWFTNPMSLKIPLYNPDHLLERLNPFIKQWFTFTGLIIWLAIVIPALIIAFENWSELTSNLSDRVLSSSNLLIMAMVFPIVKLFHEFGHGCANKAWGGRVNEMGLMFLVFAPSPYVDASSSNIFSSKYRRALVASAGMLAELLLAAIALYIWQFAEQGILRAVAYNVIVICGISTLIVNGNPLLKYDGYYILSDLIEMPNLAQRGTKYWTYLWNRYACGKIDEEPPKESSSERNWLLFYTPASWIYRTFVTMSIMLIIAKQFFFFGVLLALWSAFTLICMPLWKIYKHNFQSSQLERQRQRAVRVTLGLLCLLVFIAFIIPLPLYTRSEGVIWLPDHAILNSGENGTFQRWLVQPGQYVKKGTALYLLADASIASQLETQKQKLLEADANYRSDQFTDLKKAQLSLHNVEKATEELKKTEEQAANLIGYAKSDGLLVAEKAHDIIGQTIKKGELIGYVLKQESLITRVTISQEDVDLVRNRFQNVQIKLAQDPSTSLEAKVIRQMPGGVDELPSSALSLNAGGAIPTDPNDPNSTKTLQRFFIMDLAFDRGPHIPMFGARVQCRFYLGLEPIGLQGLRRLRQLFLSHFDV